VATCIALSVASSARSGGPSSVISYFSKTAAGGCAVRRPLTREGAKLLVELVAAAGGVDDDELAVVVGQVEECVREAPGEIGEAALRDLECLVADRTL
jgi:hypothetical protein